MNLVLVYKNFVKVDMLTGSTSTDNCVRYGIIAKYDREYNLKMGMNGYLT
jgi:hypothetical protein